MPGSNHPIVVEQVRVGDLRPDPGNPRRADQATLDALDRSIDRFGIVQPIVARRADGRVIAGHQRLARAVAAGYATVSVVYVELDDNEAALLGLALNRIHAGWDEPLLARLLAGLRDEAGAAGLAAAGFGDDEVKRLLASLDARERGSRPETFDLEAALALASRTRTAIGEVWRLGDHRLAVGDCTDPAVVDRLLAGERPALCVTDPPYGVNYQGGAGRGGRRRGMANDALLREQWTAFVKAWTALVITKTDGAVYAFMSAKEWPTVARELEAADGHWSTTIIWTKDRPTLGRSDYQRGFEVLWYGWREGAKHFWCGDRDQSDLWSFDRPDANVLHPTQKPLGIYERAIRNSSRPADLVLDPFAGSGTAVIAAERTGRRCAAIELDPRFADAIVERWQAFSGRRAVRVEPGAEGGAA